MEEINEIQKLRSIEYNLTKQTNDLLKQFSKYDQTFDSVNFKTYNDQLRIRDVNVEQNNLRTINEPLKKIKRFLDQGGVSSLDLKSLRHEMEQIQTNIQDTKCSSKANLEKLKNEELELQNYIDTIKEKIDGQKKDTTHNRKLLSHTKDTSSSSCPEVQEYNKFLLSSGGHENRWPLDDHNLFLKLRNKYKREAELAKNLHKLLPDISEQAVIRHEIWYREYLRLKEAQQKAIKKWRQSKVEGVRNDNKYQAEPPKKETKKAQNIDRDLVKEQLLLWKEEREKKMKEMSKEKMKELHKKREMEEKEKGRLIEIKKQIELWKMNKEMAKKREEQKKEKEALVIKELKSSKANDLIKVFQLQDKMFMDRKKFVKMRAKSLDHVGSTNKLQVARDPERLLRPTKQWLHRTSSLDENPNKSICFINTIKKLGVPEWRKAAM